MATPVTAVTAVIDPLTPFRIRITLPGAAPGWLREGTGERLLYTFGLMVDARLERLRQGVLAHMPRRSATGNCAPFDALLVIAGDRLIVPGLTEGQVSLATREQRAFDDWQLAGLARSTLAESLGFLLTFQPEARTVSASFDPSTFPPSRADSTWTTYAEGTDTQVAPVVSVGTNGGNGDWDWDSLSSITGSSGWWSAYVIIYATAPQDWCHVAEAWGTGSVYTPSGDGYYSTASGGAYVGSGSYAGTSRPWGNGSTFSPSMSGYYSAASGGEYKAAGSYNGVSVGWGVDVLGSIGETLLLIVKQRKPANVWVRSIIVSFVGGAFDPSEPAGGGVNPDGFWGQWSKVVAGAYVASRFDTAVYGSEVV